MGHINGKKLKTHNKIISYAYIQNIEHVASNMCRASFIVVYNFILVLVSYYELSNLQSYFVHLMKSETILDARNLGLNKT